MVKTSFKRSEIVHNGIIRIRLCLVRYKSGNTDLIKEAFDIAGGLFCLEIIPFDKYDLLIDIIERVIFD